MNVAPIGLGGFAGDHHSRLHALEKEGFCRVVAACDPEPHKFADFMEAYEFESRGIPVYTDYRDMLAAHRAELDFATVPTPIAWHAPMHRACVEAGIPCFLEKPPTLNWEELDEMLQVETRAEKETLVGFAYTIEKSRLHLKQRLVDGEFGRVLRVGFHGWSPRDDFYYNRAPWSGRLILNDRIVLDSCLGNAMSHFVHNLLFWCGQDEILSWEPVQQIEAELYRAHDIENFDTCFARGVCNNGVEVRVAATHTGASGDCMREWIECEKAFIHYESGINVEYSIRWHDGRREERSTPQIDLLRDNLREYMAYLHGESKRPLTRLSDSLPFVHFNDLLYVASAGIQTIPGKYLKIEEALPPFGEWITVVGLELAMREFEETGCFPGEGSTPWGRAGGRATAAEVDRLLEIVRAMQTNNEARRAEPVLS